MIHEKRPWGHYKILHQEPGIQIKRLEIKPGSRFSLQKHSKRIEKWIVLSGNGSATIGTKECLVNRGTMIEVPCGEVHRMHNIGKIPLVFIEIQFGEYLGEDDIVRLEDDFGRS